MSEQRGESNVITYYSELVANHRDTLLLAPIALYVIGFFIANVHLGSLGITNFDLLRARYILVGGMFVIFVGVLIALFKALFRRLENKGVTPWRRIQDSLWYSFQAIGLVFILGIVLRAVSGELSAPAVWITSPLSEAIDETLRNSNENLRLIGGWLILYMSLFVGIFIYVLLRPGNNPDGTTMSRAEVFRSIPYVLILFLLSTLVMIVAVLTVRFIGAIGSAGGLGRPRPFLSDITPLLWLIITLFGFGAVLILSFSVIAVITPTDARRGSAEKKEQSGVELPGSMFPLEGIIILLVVLFIFYTAAAYPGIPQQIGGGAAIPVRIALGSQDQDLLPHDCHVQAYAVDRTSRTTILVVFDEVGDRLRTFEISNSEIVAIEYYPDC